MKCPFRRTSSLVFGEGTSRHPGGDSLSPRTEGRDTVRGRRSSRRGDPQDDRAAGDGGARRARAHGSRRRTEAGQAAGRCEARRREGPRRSVWSSSTRTSSSRPPSSAVSPDGSSKAWRDGRLQLDLAVTRRTNRATTPRSLPRPWVARRLAPGKQSPIPTPTCGTSWDGRRRWRRPRPVASASRAEPIAATVPRSCAMPRGATSSRPRAAAPR